MDQDVQRLLSFLNLESVNFYDLNPEYFDDSDNLKPFDILTTDTTSLIELMPIIRSHAYKYQFSGIADFELVKILETEDLNSVTVRFLEDKIFRTKLLRSFCRFNLLEDKDKRKDISNIKKNGKGQFISNFDPVIAKNELTLTDEMLKALLLQMYVSLYSAFQSEEKSIRVFGAIVFEGKTMNTRLIENVDLSLITKYREHMVAVIIREIQSEMKNNDELFQHDDVSKVVEVILAYLKNGNIQINYYKYIETFIEKQRHINETSLSLKFTSNNINTKKQVA